MPHPDPYAQPDPPLPDPEGYFVWAGYTPEKPKEEPPDDPDH